jgi:hypothetical protein
MLLFHTHPSDDTARIHELANLYHAAAPEGEDGFFVRWWTAMVLGDTATLARLRESFDELSLSDVISINHGTIVNGLPPNDWERAVAVWDAKAATERERAYARSFRYRLAAIQGRVREIVALQDSAPWPHSLLEEALANSAYDSAATAAWNAVAGADQTTPVCSRGILHAARGDARMATRAIDSLMTVDTDSAFVLCRMLIEAMVEGMEPRRTSWPALERLDSLVRLGPPNNFPGLPPINLVIARLREVQGDLPAALAATRRRFITWTTHNMLTPAYLREEGRLAALVGDTTAAIRAYDHYLTLRTDPDPGPMLEEVDRVRRALAELVGEGGR